MASNTTSTSHPSLAPGISDFHLSLLLPIAVHWLTSGFFEICDRTGWLGQHRLHTSAEELARNRVTRRECLRVTLQCQASRLFLPDEAFSRHQGLQVLLGLALGALGEGEEDAADELRLAVLAGRVRAVFAAAAGVLPLSGIDFKTIMTLSGHKFDSIEALTVRLLYWYIVPVFQLAAALVVADAWMYGLHRLGHTNKWIYSKSTLDRGHLAH